MNVSPYPHFISILHCKFGAGSNKWKYRLERSPQSNFNLVSNPQTLWFLIGRAISNVKELVVFSREKQFMCRDTFEGMNSLAKCTLMTPDCLTEQYFL